MPIVIYIDEVCPGNPLRPGNGRRLQCVYWFVRQWPAWLVTRTAVWPTIGLLCSSKVDSIPGGMSGFFAKVLDLFWGGGREHNFQTGVQLQTSTGRFTVRGSYAGILGDEKCLK